MGPLLGTFSLGAYLGKGALQYFSKRYSWYKCCWSYKPRYKCEDRYHGVDEGTWDSNSGNIGWIGQAPRKMQTAHSQAT